MSEPYDIFRKEAAEKIRDGALQTKLADARHQFNRAFEDSIKQFSNLETAKRRASFLKWKSLGNLDKYLIEFEANFIKNGGKVIWAQDAAEACSEVLGIINRSGEKQIVKAKTLTADEIGLDEAMQQLHKEWTETDLGQFILQLSGDHASHMVMPAIHKSKPEVSSLFHDKLGSALTGDTTKLSETAASVLRSKYLTAGIGITGANFIVADPGVISITENEGNAILAASKPKIHIVLVGIDKVIPSINDLNLFLPLLATYGTGQKITAYNSIIRGPKKNGEVDGPEEMYVVLIDNGRTRVLENEVQREAASCIRCGACLNSDPVYSVIGGHPYRSTWMGPIGTVVIPHIQNPRTHSFMSELTTLSGADTEICPVLINFNKLILENRKQFLEKQGTNASGKLFYFFWKRAMLKRDIMNWKGIKTKSFIMNAIFSKSPQGLRTMRGPAKESFNEQWRKRMHIS